MMVSHYWDENFEELVDLYPFIVEEVIKAQFARRKVLSEYKNEDLQQLSSDEFVKFSSDIRLEYDPITAKYICCFKNQSLSDRLAIVNKQN